MQTKFPATKVQITRLSNEKPTLALALRPLALLSIATLLLTGSSAHAGLAALYSFNVAGYEASPNGLAQGSDGTVFKITTNGALTTLHDFGIVTSPNGISVDGMNPNSLTLGSDGNFYGTTEQGISYISFDFFYGTIFKITTNGALTTEFSAKPVMLGSGGASGEAYAWAEANPEKVSAIYALNPYLHSQTAKTQPLDNLAPLAKAGIPLLDVCGSLDPWYSGNTQLLEQRYKDLGGKITVIVKEGQGHAPLSPEDLPSVVDFLTQAVK